MDIPEKTPNLLFPMPQALESSDPYDALKASLSQQARIRERELESLIAKFLEQNPTAKIADLQLVEQTHQSISEGHKVVWYIEFKDNRKKVIHGR